MFIIDEIYYDNFIYFLWKISYFFPQAHILLSTIY